MQVIIVPRVIALVVNISDGMENYSIPNNYHIHIATAIDHNGLGRYSSVPPKFYKLSIKASQGYHPGYY